jgi:hypothetical protein
LERPTTLSICARLVTFRAGVPAGRTAIVNSIPSCAEIRISVSMPGLTSPNSSRATCGCFIPSRCASSRCERSSSPVAHDRDCHRAGQRGPCPLRPELRVRGELLGDHGAVHFEPRPRRQRGIRQPLPATRCMGLSTTTRCLTGSILRGKLRGHPHLSPGRRASAVASAKCRGPECWTASATAGGLEDSW